MSVLLHAITRSQLSFSPSSYATGLKKGLDAQIIPDLIFASERTLAGWLAQGRPIMLISHAFFWDYHFCIPTMPSSSNPPPGIGMWHTGMGLMNFGNRTADWCGYILAPIGMYFCVYAFYLYAIRLKLLKNGKPLPYALGLPFLTVSNFIS